MKNSFFNFKINNRMMNNRFDQAGKARNCEPIMVFGENSDLLITLNFICHEQEQIVD